jgi:type II secretory pathway component PulK
MPHITHLIKSSSHRQSSRLKEAGGRRKQAGVALITVLLVFAIATLIASKIIIGKVLDMQRTTGMINRTQAYYYALAAEDLAILALQENIKQDTAKSPQGDHLDEFWAQGPMPFEIDNIGSVVVNIVDINRFYNINNLVQYNNKVSLYELERFRGLLVELDIDDALADNLRDWLDVDNRDDGFSSDGEAYANQEPGYLVGNQRLTDVSELRLINGFDANVMAVLLPHITAIKTHGVLPINVNTASVYALATLQVASMGNSSGNNEGIGYANALDIIGARSEPFVSLVDFSNRVSLPNLQFSSQFNPGTTNQGSSVSSLLATYSHTSEYFEINIRANYAGSIAYLSTIVRQKGYGEAAKFIVLSRRETDNSYRFIEAVTGS